MIADAASTNPYDVLQVARDASARDVKKAFYRLLRENPPEQKPKEYQRLREAYDLLSDPVARKEYDDMSLFGEEIEALRTEAEAIMDEDEPNYAEAERLLKKAVVLGPQIGLLRNLLGLCFLRNDQPRRALKQFEKACEINPKNEAYLFNAATAHRDLGHHDRAEAIYRDVWERDAEDYAAPRALADLLYDQDRKREAHKVLDQAIHADGQVDFQDFFCIYDKVHFHLRDDETEALRKQLRIIQEVAQGDADRQFASFLLARTGAQLYDVGAYSLANDFSTAARKLAPDQEFVQELADASAEASALHDGFKAVFEDESYDDIVKDIVRVHAGANLGHIEPEDAVSQMMAIGEGLDKLLDVDPFASDLKRSARRLQREHPALYEVASHPLDAILKAPKPKLFGADCPYCSKPVVVDRWERGRIGCPHCYKRFKFTGDAYQRVGQNNTSSSTSSSSYSSTSSSSSSGEGSGIGVIIFWVVFIVIAINMCN